MDVSQSASGPQEGLRSDFQAPSTVGQELLREGYQRCHLGWREGSEQDIEKGQGGGLSELSFVSFICFDCNNNMEETKIAFGGRGRRIAVCSRSVWSIYIVSSRTQDYI